MGNCCSSAIATGDGVVDNNRVANPVDTVTIRHHSATRHTRDARAEALEQKPQQVLAETGKEESKEIPLSSITTKPKMEMSAIACSGNGPTSFSRAERRHHRVVPSDPHTDTFQISASTATEHAVDTGADISWVDVSQPTHSIMLDRAAYYAEGAGRTYSIDMTSEFDLTSVDRGAMLHDRIRHAFLKRVRRLLLLEADGRMRLTEMARVTAHAFAMQAAKERFTMERRDMLHNFFLMRTTLLLSISASEEAMHRQYISQAHSISLAALYKAEFPNFRSRSRSIVVDELSSVHKTIDSQNNALPSATTEVDLTNSGSCSDDDVSGRQQSLSVTVRRLSKAHTSRPTSAPVSTARRTSPDETATAGTISSHDLSTASSHNATSPTPGATSNMRRVLQDNWKSGVCAGGASMMCSRSPPIASWSDTEGDSARPPPPAPPPFE